MKLFSFIPFNKNIVDKFLIIGSLFILFSTIYLNEIGITFTFNRTIVDGDNYVGLFKHFLEKGFYNSIAEGTSVFYNLSLYPIYLITNDIQESIFLLNILSISISFCIVCYLLYKIVRDKVYYLSLIILLISLFIGKKLPILSNDDLFSGMFYSLIIYCLYQFHQKRKTYYFIIIGILLGICFSIRELTILWTPIIGVFLIYYSNNIKTFLKNSTFVATFMIGTMYILHFPSLYENRQLSYYDKNPENKNLNWIQRNHLGLKKIDEGKIPIKPWAIWKGTSFPEVEQYLKNNGEDSLPKTLFAAIKKAPILFLKITGYNLYITFKHYFSYLGFLIFLPFLVMLHQRKLISTIYYGIFILFSIMICSVAYSFVEFRWFHGMETFLFLSIGITTHYLLKNKEKTLQMFFGFSIIFILIDKVIGIVLYY